jgi:condensin complex subunit 1
VNDVTESIKLLSLLKKLQIKSSEEGLKKILVLIWSKEKIIKTEVLNTFYEIFMNDRIIKRERICKNLIEIVKISNLTEKVSIEEILKCMME